MKQENGQVISVCVECGAPVSFPKGALQVDCEFRNAGMAVGKETVLVRLACPACHRNFYYIDGMMAGQCPFCETPLVALTRNRLWRYVIPPRPEIRPDHHGAELRLVPF